MCGLIGVAGDNSGTWKDLYVELLVMDSLRGMHSTGAGFVGREKDEFTLVKRPGHPFNLINTDKFQDAMKVASPQRVMMGHNRYATIGEKTEANAHPFMFENVIGMHNGTLDKWIIKNLHNEGKYGTDSEAIFATLNETDIADTVGRITGAWALVWFDKRDSTLNFLRNDKRPLHYCYSQDRCTLVWASEAEMLTFAMGRRGKKMHNDEIYTVTENTHYSWKVPDSIAKKFDAPTQTTVEGKKWGYESWQNFGQGTTTYVSKKYKHHQQKLADDNIISFAARPDTSKFRPPYKDLYGKVMNKTQFHQIVAEGCCMCGSNDQKWGEFIHVMSALAGKNTPYLCEECFNSDETYDFVNYAL